MVPPEARIVEPAYRTMTMPDAPAPPAMDVVVSDELPPPPDPVLAAPAPGEQVEQEARQAALDARFEESIQSIVKAYKVKVERIRAADSAATHAPS